MRLIESLNLGSCTIDIWSSGITTRFPDGKELYAEPEDNDAYRLTALNLGYATDTLLMCQEHELSHTILSTLLGFPYSPTLWHVAHGTTYAFWQQEEKLVLALQEYRHHHIFELAYSMMEGH